MENMNIFNMKKILHTAILFLGLAVLSMIIGIFNLEDSSYIVLLALSGMTAMSLSMLLLLVYNRFNSNQSNNDQLDEDRLHQAINEINRITCTIGVDNEQLLNEILSVGCHYLKMSMGRISYINLNAHSNTTTSTVYSDEYRDIMACHNNPQSCDVVESASLETFISSSILVNKNFYGTVNYLCLSKDKRPVVQFDRDFLHVMGSTVATLLERDAVNQENKAKLDAENDHKNKSSFVRNLSHEIRTPLNAILGYSELLIDDARDKGNHGLSTDLNKIKSASANLLSLINDVLDISSMEPGKTDFKLQNLPSEIILKEVAESVRPLLDNNSNKLEINYLTNLGFIYSDATKYRQILVNLIASINKMISSEIISIEANREVSNDRESLVFKVNVPSQTGLGERIRKYLEVDDIDSLSVSEPEFGAELGLYICRRYCKIIGGSISIERNNKENGAEEQICVRLPVTQYQANEDDELNEYCLVGIA